MNDLIKNVNSDIRNGIKYIGIRLSDIITYTINTKEDYIIDLPISLSTLRELMNFTIYKSYYILQDEETSFIFNCSKFSIEILKIETKFKFHLLK